MRELPPALAAMGAYRQFIVYVSQPSRSRPGKTDKFPADFRTGRVANAHDAEIWTDSATAIAHAAHYGPTYGVGFVFTPGDPFFFLDVDNCLQSDNTWSPVAQDLCQKFAGCAMEISQSGKGLHVFGSYQSPIAQHGCKNEALGIELYHQGRFVALTGVGCVGDVRCVADMALPGIVAQYFPPDAQQALEQGWTEGPAAEWRGPTDDDELIRRALRSQSTASAFGGRASFADLWTGNLEALQRCYPDPARAYDASSADAALAQHLAFWTGKDCERMQRLMEKSALVRDKWER